MASAKQDLIHYLIHHSLNHSIDRTESILSATQKFNRLNLILYNELKEIDINKYHESLDLIAKQKHKNEIILFLVSEFTQKAAQRGIKSIYCKGLSLAADLYEPMEIRRCADIDILVGIDELEATLDMIGELGYLTESDMPVNHHLANKIYEASLVNELDPLKRHVSWKGDEMDISLDLHFGLFLKRWYEGAADTRGFMDRAVREIICGQPVWLLELHDRIVHLLVHFASDYTYDRFVLAFNTGRKQYPQIHQLHDIALMLDKYASVLDWNKIINRTSQLQMCREMMLAVHIFDRIYPNRIPVGFINELRKTEGNRGFATSEQALPMEKAFPALLVIDPDILIHTDISELVTKILPQFEYGHPGLHRPLLIRLRGVIEISTLHQALNEVVQHQPSLRTMFLLVDEYPVMVTASSLNLPLPMIDLQNYATHEQNQKLKELVADTVHSPFDLGHGPLIRVKLVKLSENDHVLLLTTHPSIFDEESISIFYHELGVLYTSLKTNPHQPVSMTNTELVVETYQHHLSEKELEHHLTYWKQKLSDNPPSLKLSTDHPRSTHRSYSTASQPFVVPTHLLITLRELANRENVTLSMTLFAAFGIMLYHYTQQEEFIVGTPMVYQNRDKTAIGNFTNILPLLIDLSGNPSVHEILTRICAVIKDTHAYKDVPFEELVRKLYPERDLDREPLFRVIFIFQETALTKIEFPELSLSPMPLENGTSLADITLFLVQTEQGLVGTVEYNLALFNTDTISRLIGHFQTILESIATNLEQSLTNVSLLTQDERHQLVFGWNETKVEYPIDRCLHQLFEAQVDRTPENIALVFEEQTLTYKDLNDQASNLARYLKKSGVKPETLVGICMERSVEMVVGLLGILKAGGAYVPFDPAYPQERLAFMLEDSQTPILLTQTKFLPALPELASNVVCLDKDWGKITAESSEVENSTEDVDVRVKANNLAYVIYTSGSTGKPKGAMNTHRGIVNRLLWMQDAYQLNEDDRVLQKTPFSFDVSVWEFFWPLITGARLVVAKPGGHQESAYLVSTIVEQQITTMHFVPSMLQLFLKEFDVKRCTSLRRVICSGEALPFDLKEHFLSRLSAELHNLYGPTEAAVDVTYWACEQRDGRQTVPIGRPIANTQIYILDKIQQPVPIGVPGELYIGGVGVGRGYLNRSELTKEKFIKDPFRDEPEAYLYRTGDLVRYGSCGEIEFLGRIDHQIKLHGQRVELGEIETALMTHPAVQEALVMVREDATGDQRLVAYVILRKEEVPMVGDYRIFLQARLPHYMIPTSFIHLQSFPLLTNGKIDRHALPQPSTIRPDLQERFVLPRTKVEQTISEIWKEELRVKQVGIYDNFFDLGGDSLLMIRVYNRLCDRLQFTGALVEMYRHPTIDSLVKHFNAIHFQVSMVTDSHKPETRRTTLERQTQSRAQRKSFRQELGKSSNIKDK